MLVECPDRPLTSRDRGTLAAVLVALALTILATQAGCEDHSLPDGCIIDNPKGITWYELTVLPNVEADKGAMEIIAQMSKDYGVETTLLFVECGSENSYYWPGINTITICAEMRSRPLVETFFAAHEMGHAITTSFIHTGDEEDADQLGILSLIKHENFEPVIAGAMYWLSEGNPTYVPRDGHPSAIIRAWEASCLLEGAIRDPDDGAECSEYYRATKLRWKHRLGKG